MRTLTTDRLILRPFDDADLPRMLDTYSRPEVARWLGDGEPRGLQETVALLKRFRAPLPEPLAIRAISPIERPDYFIGAILLKKTPLSTGYSPIEPDGDIEIGWNLHPDFWGQGYATEAATRVLAEGRTHGVTRVIAVTKPGNDPSVNVMRKIGLIEQPMTQRYYNAELTLYATQDWADALA